jgi:hypothetical protein
MLRPLLVLLLTSSIGGQLSAQTLTPLQSAPPAGTPAHAAAIRVTLPEQAAPASTSRVVVGSALGWGVGLAGGAALGYALDTGKSGDEFFGPAGMWLGGWMGSSVGAAAGAHLANGREGNLLIGSLAVLAAAPVAALATMPLLASGVPLFVAVPAVQIVVGVAVERATARARRR